MANPLKRCKDYLINKVKPMNDLLHKYYNNNDFRDKWNGILTLATTILGIVAVVWSIMDQHAALLQQDQQADAERFYQFNLKRFLDNKKSLHDIEFSVDNKTYSGFGAIAYFRAYKTDVTDIDKTADYIANTVGVEYEINYLLSDFLDTTISLKENLSVYPKETKQIATLIDEFFKNGNFQLIQDAVNKMDKEPRERAVNAINYMKLNIEIILLKI